MREEELKRYEEGCSLLMDIHAFQNKVSYMQKDSYAKNLCLGLNYEIDADLVEDAIQKQIERYNNKINELKRAFEEL